MKLLKKLLTRFNGLQYPQEYLCLDQQAFTSPLYIYSVNKGQVVADVTHLHLFVGYHPLIFAFLSSSYFHGQEIITLVFSKHALKTNAAAGQWVALASLSLKKIHQLETADGTVFFYEGIRGKHHFISLVQQWINGLSYKMYNRKPGNVFLEGNLLQQVQIAYAVPRKISLITLGSNGLYNHFPTDLHGQISSQHYIISLRHEGLACHQVLSCKEIVLSDMEASAYQKVYALGKNHMQPLKDFSAFNFSSLQSKNFHLPLPSGAVSYKELELKDSFVAGIHRLLLFSIVNMETIQANKGALVHIHNTYATWRHKNGLEGNYLLR